MAGKENIEKVLTKDIEDLGKRIHAVLEKMRIRFFVVGAVDCGVWGKPRRTFDIDLVIVIEPGRVDNLLSILQSQGFTPAKPKAKERLMKNLPVKFRDPKTTRSVDFRIASYTIDREALERATEVEIFGKRWKVAPPEELILYKLGRRNLTRFDREDIQGIIETQGDKLDWDRMERLANSLSKEYSPDFRERLE